jgi:hypothetical protein
LLNKQFAQKPFHTTVVVPFQRQVQQIGTFGIFSYKPRTLFATALQVRSFTWLSAIGKSPISPGTRRETRAHATVRNPFSTAAMHLHGSVLYPSSVQPGTDCCRSFDIVCIKARHSAISKHFVHKSLLL